MMPFRLTAAALALASVAALAGEKRVTILFTGDNGGEVAPCG